MTVIGYLCIYSLLLGIEVAAAAELYSLYLYIVSRFTVKRKHRFVTTLTHQEL